VLEQIRIPEGSPLTKKRCGQAGKKEVERTVKKIAERKPKQRGEGGSLSRKGQKFKLVAAKGSGG